ncbi:MAG TPA: hypothetical protein VFV33_18145 [Gemmatimonadaceae bacterium]|nr:hypothetical protein [Gemmatimonadaceae bacterium]
MAKTTTTAPVPTPATGGFAPTRALGATAQGRIRPNFGDRRRPFLFGANPGECDLVKTSQGWRLVPVLKPLIVAPGVNSTEQPKKGGVVSHTRIEANARAKWAMVVLHDRSEYQVEVDGEGGPGIFTKWERIRAYADGKWSIDHDDDGYDLWRWSLVVDGRIEIREDGVQLIKRRIRRQKDRASRTPHLAAAQRAMDEATTREAGLEEALKALRSPVAPAPDPRDEEIAKLRAELAAKKAG